MIIYKGGVGAAKETLCERIQVTDRALLHLNPGVDVLNANETLHSTRE